MCIFLQATPQKWTPSCERLSCLFLRLLKLVRWNRWVLFMRETWTSRSWIESLDFLFKMCVCASYKEMMAICKQVMVYSQRNCQTGEQHKLLVLFYAPLHAAKRFVSQCNTDVSGYFKRGCVSCRRRQSEHFQFSDDEAAGVNSFWDKTSKLLSCSASIWAFVV